MRLWFSPHSDVPLYRQLATQVRLAILSGDLRPGDRLPSTRELARRYAIHPNTISAGYRQLEQDGWTELRHGSGVYVRTRDAAPSSADARIDCQLDTLIASLFTQARDLGLPVATVRARLQHWLASPAPDHLLLVDPDPELRCILLTELRRATHTQLRDCSPADCAQPELLARAVACCRPSQEQAVRAALPAGTPLVVLPITSATRWLVPWLPAPQTHLIAVVSHWPEFLSTARTMLSAAGVPEDAVLLCDARVSGWQRGLEHVSGILCDAFTATTCSLPNGPRLVVFPLLADTAPQLLQQAGL